MFTGSIVAIVTPMDEKGNVCRASLKKLIDYHVASGTSAIVSVGTTGESATLTHDEHADVVMMTLELADGRIPVIAGTGANATAEAISLTQRFNDSGIVGCLTVTPYYNRPSQEGLYQHFKAIAEHTDLPQILYNVPSRTGCNIQPETAVALAKNVRNIVGIQEASGNISQVAKLMQLADGCIELYSGNDDQVVPILSLGGYGVISVLSNVAPRQTHDMVMKYLEGDTAGSLAIQMKAIPVIDKLFCEVNPIPVKAALNQMGFEVGPLRMPLTEMEPEHQAQLKQAMIDFGIEVK